MEHPYTWYNALPTCSICSAITPFALIAAALLILFALKARAPWQGGNPLVLRLRSARETSLS
jgi:hypothetical protein